MPDQLSETKPFGLDFWFLIAGVPLVAVDLSIMDVLLPEIVRQLNISVAEASIVDAVTATAAGALMVPAGKLGDLFGAKHLILFGVQQGSRYGWVKSREAIELFGRTWTPALSPTPVLLGVGIVLIIAFTLLERRRSKKQLDAVERLTRPAVSKALTDTASPAQLREEERYNETLRAIRRALDEGIRAAGIVAALMLAISLLAATRLPAQPAQALSKG